MYKIGILDSGIGGLTTTSAILHKIGACKIFYYADTKNAPYGNKKPHVVFDCVFEGVKWCLERESDIIVLACNTATAVAVEAVRQRLSVPVVGVEPALKPALEAGGKILYLATPLTAKIKLGAKNGGIARETPLVEYVCTEDLAAEIEENPFGNEAADYMAANLLCAVPDAENLVLGCTHYCFLRPSVEKLFPSVRVFDGNEAVAKRVKSFLPESPLPTDKTEILFRFTGEDRTLDYMKALKNYYAYTG